MVKLVDGCNLNSSLEDLIGDDTTSTFTVTSAGIVLASANTNRRLVKVYVVSVSATDVEVWIRYGSGINLSNAAHPIPLKYLILVDSSQARGVISAVTSAGTAQLRVSVANKL